ncbi:type VI secretion system-associated FHA domain protein TagH [Methylomonas rapida]|uniref:Type VI secretion system-associated FHA domain protein TagH n=1 Tax=Methylomonas rapida TaxID=2963939 RepID=A0ABY7GMH8_9GAMM|nr:type VI secretion system-associated FHA domain protein TagH [Methylomonas rapida]WAR45707.1 type VI secretion system-associated FHA domain protein TagH [Methylomonas rapida]
MALILRTTRYKGLPPGQEISAQFDTHDGTIGRAPNNHLVLPDPEKFISRLHATIVFEGGQYFIQDSSTGGTYLDDGDTPLQQARSPLRDGQRLRIGEYELSVSITDAVPESTFTGIEVPVRQLDMADSQILQEPFAQPKPSEPTADFFSSFIEQPESAPVHESFIPPEVVAAPSAAPIDDLDFGDLLSKLEELPGMGGGAPAAKPQPPELPSLPDDFFAEEAEPVQSPPPPAETEPAFAFSEPAENLPERPAGDHAAFDPFAMPEPAVSREQPEQPIFAEPVEQVRATDQIQPLEPLDAQPQPRQAIDTPAVQAPVAEGHSTKPMPAHTATPPGDDRLLREFLAGAGINDPGLVAPEQWPALMRTSGELLRGMVDGLMQVLRARAELKSQFRVSVTTMRSVDNNPLKFTPNVDDAMKLILSPTNPGFLPPKQAVKEGFSDIMNHQIAMTAGIQAALADVLRSFDPQLIEKTHGEGVLFQKKAKCWDYYVEKYPQLKAVAQEEFFGEAFADAYEKQMLLLSRSVHKP